MTVDLSNVRFHAGETTVSTRVGVGSLRVIAPDDVALRVRGDAQLGQVELLGRTADGRNVDKSVDQTVGTEELAAATERVADGDAVFSPRLAGFVLDAFRAGEQVAGDADLNELTPREREVLQLIARGYMYKEIAARLNLSVKTVEGHVSNVLRKLQLSTRHELTRWATEHRLV